MRVNIDNRVRLIWILNAFEYFEVNYYINCLPKLI